MIVRDNNLLIGTFPIIGRCLVKICLYSMASSFIYTSTTFSSTFSSTFYGTWLSSCAKSSQKFTSRPKSLNSEGSSSTGASMYASGSS